MASNRPFDCFSEKYDKYAMMLYRIAIAQLGNRQDAQEVLQDAFIRLLYRAPVFVSDEHEKAWLIRVTINLCKNRLRNPWHRRVVLADFDCADTMPPEDAFLLQQVLGLPSRYKSVIHLHYYEGYSVSEIAGILRIGQSAVKMRLKRGRSLLKMEMEGEAQ
jgi:RNA polymerase sigma-70 factor (ECF subfamily)